MSILRAAVALVGLLVPPAIVTFLACMLYDLGRVMGAVVFLVVFSLWFEAIRALRRLD